MVLGDFEDAVGHEHVVAVEIGFVFHVCKEAADFCGEVDDVRRFVFGKDGAHILEFSERASE